VVGRQETVVQKNRVKALDGDWNALKQKLRLSVLPAHEKKHIFLFSFLGLSRYIPEEGKINKVIIIKIIIRRIYRPNVW